MVVELTTPSTVDVTTDPRPGPARSSASAIASPPSRPAALAAFSSGGANGGANGTTRWSTVAIGPGEPAPIDSGSLLGKPQPAAPVTIATQRATTITWPQAPIEPDVTRER